MDFGLTWLREKDSNLHYCVQSAACCLVTPSHNSKDEVGRMRDEGSMFCPSSFRLHPSSLFFLAPGEGFEPSSLESKSNVLPVALSRKLIDLSGSERTRRRFGAVARLSRRAPVASSTAWHIALLDSRATAPAALLVELCLGRKQTYCFVLGTLKSRLKELNLHLSIIGRVLCR